MVVVNGFLFGMTLAVMLGPVFFTLLQTSLEKGFDKALIVALGVSVGDIIMISLVYLGFSKLIGFEANKEIIAYCGAVILAVFGLVAIFKSRRTYIPRDDNTKVKGFFRFFLKGLFINAISPFVPIFWVGTMSLATVQYEYEGITLFTFFAVILIVVFLTDALKAFLAQKLHVLMNARVMKLLNVIVGVVLILFAIRMATYY